MRGRDLAVIALAGCAAPDDGVTPDELALLATLSPDLLPTPGPDASNRYADDPAAAVLGQKLFFETGFSGALAEGDDDGSPGTLGAKGETGKVACAGCHVPSAGFADNRSPGMQISLGAGWGRRRAPSLLDVGQAKLLMWDGRHDALYNQIFGPLESPVEMNSSRLYAAEQLAANYRGDYEAVFGPMPVLDQLPQLSAAMTGCTPSTVDTQPACNGVEHGVPGAADFDALAAADQIAVTRVVANMGKAIGAYERLLACGPGRFDRWMHGGDPLSASEQRGAQLFVGKGGCVVCHSGPFFSDQQFHAVGLKPATVAVVFIDADDRGAATGLAAAIADPLGTRGSFSDGDDGRLPAAVDPAMTGAFRTPTLRCSAHRPAFMHTGQLHALPDVVTFFSRGGDPAGYEGANELVPLALTVDERADLVEFLGALDGDGPPANLLGDPR